MECITEFTGNGRSLTCTPTAPDLKEGNRWPDILGIGPAKSGSTHLSQLVMDEGIAIVGNATLGGRTCCGPELYWLLDEKEMSRGRHSYSKYFKTSPDFRTVFFEKTPHYSADMRVPYRARVFLGSQVKLIFTLRPPLALDASLYMHREAYTKKSYPEWVQERVDAYLGWIKCRKNFMQSTVTEDYHTDHITNSYLNKLLDSTSFDWRTSALIETHMSKHCAKEYDDTLNEALVVNGMRRWLHVYNNPEQWLCITTDMYKQENLVLQALRNFVRHSKEQVWTARNITHRLNLHSIKEPQYEGRLMMRLMEVHKDRYPEKINELNSTISRLGTFIDERRGCEDHIVFLRACGFIPPGFHACNKAIDKV